MKWPGVSASPRPSTWTPKATWCWKSIRSARSARLEGVVDLYLVSAGEPVRFVGHSDHGHQLGQHGVRHAGLSRRGGVRGNAVRALIAGADGEIQHLFGD